MIYLFEDRAMRIRFETCERKTALRYLQHFYQNRILEDKGNTKAVLDLVEADIFRIPDPKFHPGGQVYPGKNWDESKKDKYLKAFNDFNAEKE